MVASTGPPQAQETHAALLARVTGAMVAPVAEFEGSPRLRPDGRPRPDFRQELRQIANVKNGLAILWLVALLVLTVMATVAVSARLATATWAGAGSDAVATTARWGAVLAVMAISVMVMGCLQLRLFVLHHEAAHRLLFSRKRVNDLIGINLLGWLAFGTGAHSYRRVHVRHHRDEFGPEEPDFLLYSFYPITHRSLARKLRRDAFGVSAWRILKPLLVGIAKPGRRSTNSLRFYLGQAIVFVPFALTGHPWLYLLLWGLPYATVYQVLNRLRAIAEHGGMTRSSDRRVTTHHVRQSWINRCWLVPYQVGHHIAHHVDSGIPFRNLPKLTQALTEAGYITEQITWSGYRPLWRAMSVGTEH